MYFLKDNEDMIESSLNQLILWLKIPKFSLNEKAQTALKVSLLLMSRQSCVMFK